MAEAEPAEATWYWNRYWHYDRLASCFDPDSNGYDSYIRAHWRKIFSAAGDEIRLLDICTGNGAIPVIAHEEAARREKIFDITGIDLADIAPPRFVSDHQETLGNITFMPRTSAEALPFPDQAFDMVTSQYGLEYTDTDKSASEAIRVLEKSGRCEFIMHAAGGSVAANARDAVEGVNFITKELTLPGKTRRAIRCTRACETGADTSAQGAAKAAAALAELETALKKVRDVLERDGDVDYMRHAAGLASNAFEARKFYPLENVLANVDQMETELEAHAARNQALADAALSRAEAEALARKFIEAGAADMKLAEFTHPEAGFCAWHFSGRRAA